MKIYSVYRALGRMEKIIFVGAIIILALSLAVKTGLYIEDTTKMAPNYGGEFREGIIGQPVFINPIVPITSADREIAKLVFGSLSSIAESIEHSEDGKTWNVRLLQNVKWHDGEPVTSDDVMFTLGVIQNREANSPLLSSFQGVTAERVSELMVKFTLQSPYAFFEEEHLNNMGVLPKHIFGDLPPQNFKLSVYGLKPIGFGPYKAESYDKDDRGIINSFRLVANDYYLPTKPFIKKFTFKFYRDDAGLREAYNLNKIDGFMVGTAASFSEANTINIRNKMHDMPSSRYYAIFINQATSNKNLKDLKVRKALSSSIDRGAITTDVLQGYASSLYGPLPLTSAETDSPDLSMLKGLKVEIKVPDEDFLVKTAEKVKESWEKQGVEVSLNVFAFKEIQENILKNADYEMLLIGNTIGAANDLFPFWHSTKRFYPDQNLALYQNKKVDALLESYRKSFDTENKLENLKKISDSIAADYPAIFLYSPQYIYITLPRLAGFNVKGAISSSIDRFNLIEEWYLNTKRVARD